MSENSSKGEARKGIEIGKIRTRNDLKKFIRFP